MNKEFVPYNEALALKELGFNEPCFGYRKEDNVFDFFGTPDRDNTNSIFQFYPTAPTYQQAFRFFREKYGLLSVIDMDNYSYYRFTIYEGKGISVAPHKTYEEAELECLIKLIKIVKEKK